MWPRSRSLGLEAASRPSNASPRSRLGPVDGRLGLASVSALVASVSASVSGQRPRAQRPILRFFSFKSLACCHCKMILNFKLLLLSGANLQLLTYLWWLQNILYNFNVCFSLATFMIGGSSRTNTPTNIIYFYAHAYPENKRPDKFQIFSGKVPTKFQKSCKKNCCMLQSFRCSAK